jgi:DNA-binding MarR family transcriptional regulator
MDALQEMASADVLYNAAVAERLGITAMDLRCLSHLDRHGPTSPGKLGAWSGLTSGAVTGVVNRLAAAGLARRDPDPGDARRVVVTAEPRRRAEVEALMRPLGERLSTLAAELPAAERARLISFTESAAAVLAAEARRIRYNLD